MGCLVSIAGPCPVGCQGLLCAEAASHWLIGLGQEEVGCRNLGDLGLLLAHWWVEPGSGVGGCGAGVPKSCVILQVDRAVSCIG